MALDKNTNEEILHAQLKAGSSAAFEQVYRNNFSMILKLVSDNNGSLNDARDVFQEAMFVLVKKIREPDFKLTGKLSTYLFAVARNIWFKRTRGTQGKTNPTAPEKFAQMNLALPEDEQSESIEKEKKFNLLAEKMKELDPDCQRVLFLSIQKNFSQKEIADIMDYSPSFVKVKKFRCLKYLREKVSGLPEFRNL